MVYNECDSFSVNHRVLLGIADASIDYEHLPENSVQMVYIAMIRLMVQRLA